MENAALISALQKMEANVLTCSKIVIVMDGNFSKGVMDSVFQHMRNVMGSVTMNSALKKGLESVWILTRTEMTKKWHLESGILNTVKASVFQLKKCVMEAVGIRGSSAGMQKLTNVSHIKKEIRYAS